MKSILRYSLGMLLVMGFLAHGRTGLPLVNAGFEEGMLGWQTDSSGMILFLESAAHKGTMGIRLHDTSLKSDCWLHSELLSCQGGRAYELSLMGRTESSSESVTFALRYYDQSKHLLKGASTAREKTFRMDGEWRRYACASIAPASAHYLQVSVESGKVTMGQVDLDDLAVSQLNEQEMKALAEANRQAATCPARRRMEKRRHMLQLPYGVIEKLVYVIEIAVHPRLFASEPTFAALRHHMDMPDSIHAKAYGRLVFLADSLLKVPLLTQQSGGDGQTSISRQALFRISTLAMCYRLSGKASYRERCLEELRELCRLKDWNLTRSLEVAEMTLAVATGYDWLYADLTDADRKLMSAAILQKGLKSGGRDTWWEQASSYWLQVCHAGLLAGALAVAEQDSTYCTRRIYESICALGIPMSAYAPRGNYPEGVEYWVYGTGFNLLALSLLHQAFGTDFGLSTLPGFRATGTYLDIMTGPSGLVCNFSDCRVMRRSTMGLPWWFAMFFDDPALVERFERASFERLCRDRSPLGKPDIGDCLFAYSLLWLIDDDEDREGDVKPLPLIWDGGGEVPVAVMRSGWGQEAVFVGVKGGSPSHAHGQMDGGSFVLDAGTIRWLCDLGAEDEVRATAAGIDMTDMTANSGRWKLFRLNNRSHNTLMIAGRLQQVEGRADILTVRKGDTSMIEVDMTGLYDRSCSGAHRTFELTRQGEVLVTDTLSGLKPGTEVVWGAGTMQDIHRAEGQRITLQAKGRRFFLENSGKNGVWRVRDAAKARPDCAGNSDNPGFKRLELVDRANAQGRLTIRVRMGMAQAEGR